MDKMSRALFEIYQILYKKSLPGCGEACLSGKRRELRPLLLLPDQFALEPSQVFGEPGDLLIVEALHEAADPLPVRPFDMLKDIAAGGSQFERVGALVAGRGAAASIRPQTPVRLDLSTSNRSESSR